MHPYTFQDSNLVWLSEVIPVTSCYKMKGWKIKFRCGYLIQANHTPVINKYYFIDPLTTDIELVIYYGGTIIRISFIPSKVASPNIPFLFLVSSLMKYYKWIIFLQIGCWGITHALWYIKN